MFIATQTYAITFDYIDLPPPAMALTQEETMQVYNGTPDNSKPDGVNWGKPEHD